MSLLPESGTMGPYKGRGGQPDPLLSQFSLFLRANPFPRAQIYHALVILTAR